MTNSSPADRGPPDGLYRWPDGQVRDEAPYRCGAFVTGRPHEQCTKLSDHDGPHVFATDDADLALVMRCIQKIVTMPDREHTHMPTKDLKAFARLVTAQLERIATLELDSRRLTEERDALRHELALATNTISAVNVAVQVLGGNPEEDGLTIALTGALSAFKSRRAASPPPTERTP